MSDESLHDARRKKRRAWLRSHESSLLKLLIPHLQSRVNDLAIRAGEIAITDSVIREMN